MKKKEKKKKELKPQAKTRFTKIKLPDESMNRQRELPYSVELSHHV